MTKTTGSSFQPGQHTSKVWSGDIVTDCEFIRPLNGGGLLFYDHTFRCFRRAFWEQYDGSRQFVLNGWDCSDTLLMIGSSLTRFATEQQFLLFDVETCGLNLGFHLPWELSYVIATIKGGISSVHSPVHTHMIRWPHYEISDELAMKVHFDRARYEAEAKSPQEVWEEFSKHLYSPEVRAIGHNLLGFDVYMVNTWRAAMGLPCDSSWIYRPLIDTNCLAKAYFKHLTPDISSAEAFLAWNYKVLDLKEKGLKSSLGHMCGEFKIEYDAKTAHSARYDIERNWLVFKALLFAVEF